MPSSPEKGEKMIARNFRYLALSASLVLLLTAFPLAQYSVAAEKDIVDTAVSAGSFKTLVAAVKAAGLVETLKDAGPFTVFAPTDEAFGKVPKDMIGALLKPENKDKLTAILTAVSNLDRPRRSVSISIAT